jgi:putative flippase GtrA
MRLLSHLMKTAVRAFFRIALTFVLFGAIGVGVSLLVAYQMTHVWPPTVLADVIAGAIGVLLGYAAGLTVLVREAIGGVLTAEHDIAGGIERVVEAPARHS